MRIVSKLLSRTSGKTAWCSISLAALCIPLSFLLGGCVVEEQPMRVRRAQPVVVEEPAPVVEQPAVVVEPYQPAPVEAVNVYEADLSPHGRWLQVGTWGRCWAPAGIAVDWQPYTVGHWINTDDGWSWVADGGEADWGYVTYHYGRWHRDPGAGWVWIPGTTWAPAWVAWRDGGGYCGWAPLPPECGMGVNVSLVEVNRYVPAERFVCVDERYMADTTVVNHIIRNNVTIVNKTTNITKITVVNNRIVNRGVSVTRIEQASGHKIERVELQKVTSASEAAKLRAEGKHVEYAPDVVRKADASVMQKLDAHQREAQAHNKPSRDDKDKEARDKAARDEKAKADERDKAAREAKDKEARDKAARDEKAKADERDKAAREAKDKEARDKAARDEKAKADERDKAAREAKDKEARDKAARDEKAKADERDKAAREAKDKEARDKAARDEKDKADRDKAARDEKAKTDERNKAARDEKAKTDERDKAAREGKSGDKPEDKDKDKDKEKDKNQ